MDKNSQPPVTRRSRRKLILIWLLAILVALVIGAAISIQLVATHFEPEARKWLLAAIQKRYESGVEFGEFHARFYPVPTATVDDIVIRFHRRTDLIPLAVIKHMKIEARLWDIWRKPIHISQVTLEGLEISIPPKDERRRAVPSTDDQGHSSPEANFLLEKVIADGMVLHLVPSDPNKDSRDFRFETLLLKSAALDRPMEFEAKLRDWKPPGKITSNGHFGPWSAGEPGATPLDGKYTFTEADLSVFHGISGTLSSVGEYHGRLNRIECNGTTDTPNFKVSVGKAVELKTEFHAIVDGTNGDTTLEPVTAHFLKSTVVARGGLIGMPAHKGKEISLNLDTRKARVEDFLHLTVNSPQPMMTGDIALRADFRLSPGTKDVIDRLNLNGHFNMPNSRFTSIKVQDILGNISRRAEGDPKGEIDEHVASSFSGDLLLKSAVVTLSRLNFEIPGARVDLAGTYAIHGGEINFQGHARTEAKLSEMTTGFKSKMLKIVDPFFAKDGAGAVIPIRITGSKNSPKFGLNFRKTKQ